MPNLLMEIRTKEADPHQRLRAIEAQRKAREKELSERTDDFTSELGNFVNGRKLKRTGGHEEVERVRARRNDNTLRKMLTGDGGSNASVGDLSTAGTLTPQLTGVSMLSSSALSPQMTGSSMISSPGNASKARRFSAESSAGTTGPGVASVEDMSSGKSSTESGKSSTE
jgi:hypothetical protein